MQTSNSNIDVDELKTFSEWILKIGDGTVGEKNDGVVDFDILDNILIRDFNDPLRAIVHNTYPNFIENAWDAKYLKQRAILAPTLELSIRWTIM